jgi:NAD(P)-dependent dehydrogenase (short-subunit alcohol dehydrogenase family)
VGAGSGIGKETAHRLAKEGASIVCVDLNEKSAQETSAELVKNKRSSLSKLCPPFPEKRGD